MLYTYTSICIYIYIPLCQLWNHNNDDDDDTDDTDTSVCEKNTPPGRKTLWKTGFQSTESGDGKFLLFECMATSLLLRCTAKSHTKGVFVTDADMIIVVVMRRYLLSDVVKHR